MRTISRSTTWCAAILVIAALSACQTGEAGTGTAAAAAPAEASAPGGGQSMVKDDLSQKNVVGVAVGSPDHSTLVTAVKAAELVDALSNAGPFTVFAPTNAAFDALPAGTVEGLLEPAKKSDLQDVLQYHVFVGVLKAESLRDGQTLGMVNGSNAKISVKDGKVMINDATVVASVPASNGIVHVIDKVILPPAPAQ
ncbi:MAG: fasciclin domain-containing protein [Flavobacteriales bacterium]|nr:fasciclin domain-containing protein [Flavobacteriales bacterium]MBK6754706.1 fasciclin domain-containing protein [Flavobacteriales bacterium]MBK7086223.1 fasciclin domain-containing protein [Flavobacteriales bacterium]MBK7271347.1 fasciclin domain-containing protein [Flavobacteriales bacterium]MBK9074568.1 fasciclin domain-containing protein [Flavobacteriales bacterium]